MAFIPEGYLPLKSAIRRLAEARQMSIRLAQAEIRAKLHSGSILAFAMEQSTGRKFGIISDSWATDHALRWLKTGTCLLPDEEGEVRITTERFDMFYQPENATIFILEDDLQRLIDAKPNDANAREAGRRVISDAEAKRQFEEWRKSREDDIPSPEGRCEPHEAIRGEPQKGLGSAQGCWRKKAPPRQPSSSET